MKTNCTLSIKHIFFLLLLLAAQAGLQAQTIISHDNVALKKTVTASSFQMTNYPVNAFDGDVNTRYSSLYSDNEWISVDLGQVFLIDQVVLVWERAYGKDFNLLFSLDGSFADLNKDSIQIRNNVLGTDSVAGTNTIKTKTNTIARYVKMQGVHRATVFGYSLFEFRVAGSISSSSVLPATLTGLTASEQGSATILEWTTTTETNTAGFSVERSSDGINFAAIGWVESMNAGNVVSHYSYTDKQQTGNRNYYRLKVFDRSGKAGSTAAVAINTFGNTGLKISPVPVKDHFSIEYNGVTGETINILLYSTGGKPVYNNKFVLKSAQQTMVINRTGNMLPGIYFLDIITNGNKNQSRMLVLQ
jgi:hypothetical protein